MSTTTAELIPQTLTPEAHAAFSADTIPIVGRTALYYSELFCRYTDHPWGIHHAAQPLRYAQHHGYDRTTMLRDLGDDVHPVLHMRVVHDDVVALGRQTVGIRGAIDLSDPQDIAVARASAIRHDAGESTHQELEMLCGGVIGDIAHGHKTAEDRILERRILGVVTGTLDGDMPDDFRQRILNVMTHQEDSAAHHLLEAAHTWGFYKTALRAGRLALSVRDQPPTLRAMRLAGLAQEVTGKSRPHLEEISSDFPAIGRRLERAEALHDAIATQL